MNKYKLIQATLSDFNRSLDYEDRRNITYINNNIEELLYDILYILRTNNPRIDDTALSYEKYRVRMDPVIYIRADKSLPYDILEIINNRLFADLTYSEIFHFRYTGNKLRQLLGKRLISDLSMRRGYINYLAHKLNICISNIRKYPYKLTNRQNQELFVIYREINFLYDEFKLFVYAK